MAAVFIAGASGFMGRRLSDELIRRGHSVTGLARAGSEKRLAAGCRRVMGDPLDAATYRDSLPGHDCFVHLVGVSHPSPAKAAEFRSIDLASAKESVAAAKAAAIANFVYVSVAHPAPVMREYIAARMEAEEAIRASGLHASILRPWYVLGPGRRWPLALLPLYGILRLLPPTRAGAQRLGLVTLEQMVAALTRSIERPPSGLRVWEVPAIRSRD
jgi:nucleoside-diphosphate-sugar epimerase